MKYPSKAYSDLVERKQAEIRGNVSSVKMTPQECREEILKATEGVIDSDRESRLALAKVGINALIDEATGYQEVRPKDELKQMLGSYTTKSGRVYKSKPGRKPKA